jgi:hypothetical protein
MRHRRMEALLPQVATPTFMDIKVADMGLDIGLT